MKIALVLGSTGQDELYMYQRLLKKNYKIFYLIKNLATDKLNEK